jgi:hypothetical protein
VCVWDRVAAPFAYLDFARAKRANQPRFRGNPEDPDVSSLRKWCAAQVYVPFPKRANTRVFWVAAFSRSTRCGEVHVTHPIPQTHTRAVTRPHTSSHTPHTHIGTYHVHTHTSRRRPGHTSHQARRLGLLVSPEQIEGCTWCRNARVFS